MVPDVGPTVFLLLAFPLFTLRVCVCSHVCAHVYVHVPVEAGDNLGCHLSEVTYLVLESGSLWPGTHQRGPPRCPLAFPTSSCHQHPAPYHGFWG